MKKEMIESKKEAEEIEENIVTAYFKRSREDRIVVNPEVLKSYFNVDDLKEKIHQVLPR